MPDSLETYTYKRMTLTEKLLVALCTCISAVPFAMSVIETLLLFVTRRGRQPNEQLVRPKPDYDYSSVNGLRTGHYLATLPPDQFKQLYR